MEEDSVSSPVTIPLWVMNEIMPALIGAGKVYAEILKQTSDTGTVTRVSKLGITQGDVDRYNRAVNICAEAMTAAGMQWTKEFIQQLEEKAKGT